MTFTPTPLVGALVVEPEPSPDARGLFARTWCRREFEARGLETRIAQCSTSFNKRRGTLRGMHYQVAPFAETKLVRCVRGSMFDVIIHLRPDAPTLTKHVAVVLSADNRKAIYVPTGFEVFYQISESYSPEHSRGVRWDDPAFGIPWPEAERTIFERERSYPDVPPHP